MASGQSTEVRSQCSTQPPPGKRIAGTRPWRDRGRFDLSSTLLLSIALFITLLTPATAFDRPRYEVRRPHLEAWQNDIVFDARPTPKAELHKRQFDLGSGTSKASSEEEDEATSTKEEKASSTTGATTGDSGIVSDAPSTSSDLPQAFDAGLGTNYTKPECLTFLRNMLSNDQLTQCLPVSLLLQNSQAFFSASRFPQTLDPILTAACNVDQRSCSSLMSANALTLRSTQACSADYDRQQPSVRQAYNGLVSYDLLYHAMCSKSQPSPANNNSADFCYTNAVTNISSPSDAYVYYLPLGISLPASSLPTCSGCLKEVMRLMGTMARNKSQPISLTYAAAAQQVNLNCGPDFVNQSISAAGGNAAAGMTSPRLGAVVLAIMGAVTAQLLGL